MNQFIKSLVNAREETQLQKEYWKMWWIENPEINSYDAMGILLMGCEL